MDTIFIVTEANEYVATGHLMECIVCAKELMKKRYFISFWINGDVKDILKKQIPCMYYEYEQTIEKDFGYLLNQIKVFHPKSVIFNLREIDKNFLKRIKALLPRDVKLLCIDEFGHRDLSADIIINPMIDSYFWDYGNSRAKLFCGAEYLILPQDLARFHLKNKAINREIRNIVITMGGVDPKNYTLDLIEIIPHCFSNSVINIIIGGGNLCQEKIAEKSKMYGNIKLFKHVTNLPQMMFEADLLICAGGNTLHEAACIGCPAVIIPSMPHEEMTAKYFEKKGFGYVVDLDKDFYIEVSSTCLRLKAVQERKVMSKRGKNISDGLGWKRVIEIIEHEINV